MRFYVGVYSKLYFSVEECFNPSVLILCIHFVSLLKTEITQFLLEDRTSLSCVINIFFWLPGGARSPDISNPGPCITNVIATCRKNFSQWESSFLWKLRYHWLKFLRRVAKTLVIQGPGIYLLRLEYLGFLLEQQIPLKIESKRIMFYLTQRQHYCNLIHIPLPNRRKSTSEPHD